MSNAQPGTPLPWKLWEKSKLHFASGRDEGGGDVIGAVDAYHWSTFEEMQRAADDAAYIVEACNAYPELQAKIATLTAEVSRLRGLLKKTHTIATTRKFDLSAAAVKLLMERGSYQAWCRELAAALADTEPGEDAEA